MLVKNLAKGPWYHININMKQFREKYNVYSTNYGLHALILKSNGAITTLDPAPYLYWLNEFNIFYTLTLPATHRNK